MTGIVMKFGEEDYFLFYNDINNFESRLFTDKPKNYVVAETIDFAEFNRRAQPLMDSFLTEEGIADRRLVFSTGDVGAYSLPFVYVDRVLELGVFLRYSPAPREGRAASKGSQVAQSAATRGTKPSGWPGVATGVIDISPSFCRERCSRRNREADVARHVGVQADTGAQ